MAFSATDDPACVVTQLWNEQLRHNRTVEHFTSLPLDTPRRPGFVRFVCISDTHNCLHEIITRIPLGDVLIHAGDFTSRGTINEILEFVKDFSKLPHVYKILIAGNHELSFDPDCTQAQRRLDFKQLSVDLNKQGISDPRQLLKDFIYLEDSACTVFKYKIYGSPWQPTFNNWAFPLDRGIPTLRQWEKIPLDTDILVTHGPPLGHGDLCQSGVRAGCLDLLNAIEYRVKPLYHIYGHIHEGYGTTTNGTTTFINASSCDRCKKPINDPVIFDLPLERSMSNC